MPLTEQWSGAQDAEKHKGADVGDSERQSQEEVVKQMLEGVRMTCFDDWRNFENCVCPVCGEVVPDVQGHRDNDCGSFPCKCGKSTFATNTVMVEDAFDDILKSGHLGEGETLHMQYKAVEGENETDGSCILVAAWW